MKKLVVLCVLILFNGVVLSVDLGGILKLQLNLISKKKQIQVEIDKLIGVENTQNFIGVVGTFDSDYVRYEECLSVCVRIQELKIRQSTMEIKIINLEKLKYAEINNDNALLDMEHDRINLD